MAGSPLLTALLLAGLAGPATDPLPSPPDGRRLCVLDLNHLGDDERHDWLGRGLADMLIVRLGRLSDFQVIEREHLRRILEEHALAERGVVGAPDAVDAARVLRADLLLVGSYALVEQRLHVETRLLRVTDQEVLAAASWEGAPDEVLQAAPRLCDELLGSLGQPLDVGRLAGIELEVPQTVDVASAYYRGVGAFEEGDYPGALSHYLQGADHEHDFLGIDRAAIRMYVLLGQSAHAVVLANSVGRRLERDARLRQSLEFRFAAAEHCLESLDAPALAIRFLEPMVAAADRYEREHHELAAAREELIRSWSPEPDSAEKRRLGELRRRLAWGLAETGWWAHAAERAGDGAGTGDVEPPEDPEVFMWRTRAQRDLARAYAAAGRIEEALAQYGTILADYEPLTHLPEDGLRRWNDGLRVEAHFMWLYHWQRTGVLDRDHPLRHVNPLNVVEEGAAFLRDFADTSIDARARVASRYDDRGYEYFDFASPAGFQIDSVTLRAEIDGIARFTFNVPEPEGWPPRISYSHRLQEHGFTEQGRYERTLDLPPGTELLSIGTSWGAGLYSNSPLENLRRRRLELETHRDVRSWSATFALSPRSGASAATTRLLDAPGPDLTRADSRLIAQFAGRGGWELGAVLRGSAAATYTGSPRLDVYAEEWVVCSLDGELFLHHRDRPLAVELPVTINTPEREFHPRLVRTHEGTLALLWSRGVDERSAQCFVAVTTDLLDWETPRRLQFAPPPPDAKLRSVEQAGDHDVLAVPAGYLMLLDHGQVRRSDDLRSWGAPTQVFEQDAWRSRLTETADGRLWAVWETSSDVREPWDSGDRMTGYYVTDGTRYKHMCEIHVAHSLDGVEWQEHSSVVLEGQGSGLWAFPVESGSIGIGVQFNSCFMKWFTTTGAGTLRAIPSSLELMCQSGDVSVFVGDGLVACLCPVFDHYSEQGTVLVGVGSRKLFEGFQR